MPLILSIQETGKKKNYRELNQLISRTSTMIQLISK